MSSLSYDICRCRPSNCEKKESCLRYLDVEPNQTYTMSDLSDECKNRSYHNYIKEEKYDKFKRSKN